MHRLDGGRNQLVARRRRVAENVALGQVQPRQFDPVGIPHHPVGVLHAQTAAGSRLALLEPPHVVVAVFHIRSRRARRTVVARRPIVQLAPAVDSRSGLDHVVVQFRREHAGLHHHAASLDVRVFVGTLHAEYPHARRVRIVVHALHHRIRLVPVGKFVDQEVVHFARRKGDAPRLLDGDHRSLVKRGVVLARVLGEPLVEEQDLRGHPVDLARLLGDAQRRQHGLDGAAVGHAAAGRAVARHRNRGQQTHEADDDQQLHERERGPTSPLSVRQYHSSLPLQFRCSPASSHVFDQ